jgi:hypothetical protein
MEDRRTALGAETGQNIMSELERVDREYRELVNKVLHANLDGNRDPEDARRLDELSKARADLSAPDYAAMRAELAN